VTRESKRADSDIVPVLRDLYKSVPRDAVIIGYQNRGEGIYTGSAPNRRLSSDLPKIKDEIVGQLKSQPASPGPQPDLISISRDLVSALDRVGRGATEEGPAGTERPGRVQGSRLQI